MTERSGDSIPRGHDTRDSDERPEWRIRDFTDDDGASWVRCRTLSFLGSSYYDDVHPEPTRFEDEAIRLVAVHPKPEGVTTPGDEEVIGVIDVELATEDDGSRVATIDTIAVHPDHLRHGIADALLAAALERLEPTGAVSLDAWTRDDEAANGWYLKAGFASNYEYVHVHKSWDDPGEGWSTPEGLSAPVLAFAHGKLEDLDMLRRRYSRVYVCRQYLRLLS